MPLSDSEQQHIRQLIADVGGASNPSGWFDVLYREAQGNSESVPWARLTVHPHLQDWLEKSDRVISGQSALVSGCGLGDDAEALAKQGYEVTAFDISETAIAWCQKRFPESLVHYQVGDIFAPDVAWRDRFDLVFEARNLQALPIGVRDGAMKAIAQCVSQAGIFLVLTNYRPTEEMPDGPPWPLSDQEFAIFSQQGLQEIHRDCFFDPQQDTVQKLRLEYHRKV